MEIPGGCFMVWAEYYGSSGRVPMLLVFLRSEISYNLQTEQAEENKW